MVSNDFFLSPLTYISCFNKKYYISHLLDSHKKVEFSNLSSLEPSNEILQNFIFYRYNELESIKCRYLELLEKIYRLSKLKIGYIETTSVCPYHCVMCPKHDNKLIRENIHMPISTYELIIKQLINQDEIELHLFGDPFCDPDIYDKIKMINIMGIIPSFSTNLISLSKIDFHKFNGLKIKYLTISFDAYDAYTLSQIRGKIEQKEFNRCLGILKCLIQYSKKTGIIKHFIFQCIRLNINKNMRGEIKKLASQYDNCFYYEKYFINFPLTKYNEQQSADEVTFFKDEKILLYNLIGQKTPFKCLKVWKKREMGITTDGNVVPCCLSFNDTVHIGNVVDESIHDIQNSAKYGELRKKIWYGEKVGSICDMCTQNATQYFHSEIPIEELQKLSKYCINRW